jgi:hypothetical protein
MRVKVLLITATIIAAEFLALAIAANSVFATSIEIKQTISNGDSSMTQSSTQTSSGLPGTHSSISSHNQLVVGSNPGNTVSTASASDSAAGLIGLSNIANIANIANGDSSMTQSSTQTSSGLPGTHSSISSHNQLVVGSNPGNTVSTASASGPSGGGSFGATSEISQSNVQNAFCIDGTSNSGSCNQAAANINFGNAVSAAIAQFTAR